MRRFLIRFLLRLLLVFAVVLGGLLLFRSHYRPLLRELAETQIKNATSDLTNDALTELLARDSIAYDRIGRTTAKGPKRPHYGHENQEYSGSQPDENGVFWEIINQEILDRDTAKLGIPIGSLVFPELFAGKGFCIPVHVLSIGNSDASFESRFQQAGINQTLHRLMMEVNVDASILVLGQTESFSLTSEVVAAETVIVGEVPGTFLNTGGIYGTQTEN